MNLKLTKSAFCLTLFLVMQSIGLSVFAQQHPNSHQSANGKRITVAVTGSLYSEISNGEARGVIAETTAAILRDMGYKPVLVTMSPGDIKRSLRDGDIEIGVGLLVKSKSSKGIAYSGSIVREYNVLLAQRGKKLEIKSLDELVGLRIGARKGFKYPLLDKRADIKLVRQRKDGENIRGLFLNDLDMAVVGSVSDIYEFRSEGVMSDLELSNKAVGYVDIGSAFSEKALGTSFANVFNQKLGRFIGGSEWKKILDRRGVLDLVKEWEVVGN